MNQITLKIILPIIGVASYIAPGTCAQIAFKKWFKTHRHNPPNREIEWTSTAKRENIPCSQGDLNVLVWSNPGPKVLLIHGWNGRASQMGAFAKPLNDVGFEVISVDLPGHGTSFGDTNSLPLSAQILCDIEKYYGPIQAFVGHSFGGAVCLLAAKEGFQTQVIVTIGAPSKLVYLLDLYARYLNFGPAAKRKLKNLLEDKFGSNIWDRCNFTSMNLDLSTKGLIIHDENDKAIPLHHAKTIANASSAQLLITTGLGHFRILRNQKVIEDIVQFIKERN